MKWYFAPGWWIRVPLTISLLAGAAFAGGPISTIMVIGGIVLLIHGWLLAFMNARKISRQIDEKEIQLKREEDNTLREELAGFLGFPNAKRKGDDR